MDPADILQALHEDLAAWVTEQSGVLSVARDPWEPLDVLSQRPDGFRVMLLFAGDEADYGDLSEVDGEDVVIPSAHVQIEIYVSLNLGLAKGRGQKAFKADAEKAPLISRLSELRARVLSLRLIKAGECLGRFRYVGSEPVVTPEGWPLAAYKLRVAMDTQVDVDEEEREVEL